MLISFSLSQCSQADHASLNSIRVTHRNLFFYSEPEDICPAAAGSRKMFRESRRLLRSRAFNVRTFGSGVAFLASLPNGLPECLIVDLQMPIMSGLALQQYLAGDGFHIPTIMITADD